MKIKAKTIGYVLLSYFQQNFIGTLYAVLAAVLWLGKLTHELLGFRLDIMILGDSPRPVILGSLDVFPLLLILSALTAWGFFFRYVLKMPHRESWDNTRHRTNAFAKNYDRVSWLTGKIAKWNVSRLIKGMKAGGKKSSFQQARMTVLTYSLVMIKQYVVTSLWVMVVPLFPTLRIHMDMLHILGMGFFITMIIFSFSLLLSDNVRTPECKGWTIGAAFFAIPVLVGSNEGLRRLLENPASEGWTIAAMAIITLVLFGLGYWKWSRTEMNFEGPEALYQY